MEIAANAVTKAKSVTVIARSEVPFKQSLGDEIGAAFLALHEKQKIRFVKNGAVKETHKEGDKVVGLTLTTGERLPVDVLVFGVGVEVKSTTSFLKGVKKDEKDGSVFCDSSLKAAEGLYVAGDIARFPDPHHAGHTLRIEHWGVAQNMGNVAGRNAAAGKAAVSYNHVPYFWTTQFGKSLRYCGHNAGHDEIIFEKGASGLDGPFVAFYAKAGQVVAAASMMRDPIISRLAELMHEGKTPSAAAIKEAIAANKLNDLIK